MVFGVFQMSKMTSVENKRQFFSLSIKMAKTISITIMTKVDNVKSWLELFFLVSVIYT